MKSRREVWNEMSSYSVSKKVYILGSPTSMCPFNSGYGTLNVEGTNYGVSRFPA